MRRPGRGSVAVIFVIILMMVFVAGTRPLHPTLLPVMATVEEVAYQAEQEKEEQEPCRRSDKRNDAGPNSGAD